MDFSLILNVSVYTDSFKVVPQIYMMFSLGKISENLDDKSAKRHQHMQKHFMNLPAKRMSPSSAKYLNMH